MAKLLTTYIMYLFEPRALRAKNQPKLLRLQEKYVGSKTIIMNQRPQKHVLNGSLGCQFGF